MKTITFINSNKRREILVDKVKYIKYQNCEDYWFYNRCIYKHLNRIEDSDYFIENALKNSILIDNEKIGKTEEIYYVSPYFDIDADIKMGAKSLSLRYLSSLIENNLAADEVLQINAALDLFCSVLSDDKFEIDHLEMNQKNLPKILSLSLLKEEYISSGTDFSYNEIIIIQLEMIEKVMKSEKQNIVILDLYYLTNEIVDKLNKLGKKCMILVLYNFSSCIEFGNNVAIGDCDLENDNDLYERMFKMSNFYDLNDFKKYIKNEYFSVVNK